MADGLSAKLFWQAPGKIPFNRLFSKVIPFVVTLEDDSIATDTIYVGAGTVAVVGANLGDFVWIAPEKDPIDKQIVAYVTAADVVTVMLSNNNASTDTDFSTGVKLNGLVLVLSDFWNTGPLT